MVGASRFSCEFTFVNPVYALGVDGKSTLLHALEILD